MSRREVYNRRGLYTYFRYVYRVFCGGIIYVYFKTRYFVKINDIVIARYTKSTNYIYMSCVQCV